MKHQKGFTFSFVYCRLTRYNLHDNTFVEVANTSLTVLSGKVLNRVYFQRLFRRSSKSVLSVRMLVEISCETWRFHQLATSLGRRIIGSESPSVYEARMPIILVSSSWFKR